MLHSSDLPLSTAYDLAMLDLDGVVYIGADAVPGAAAHIAAAREVGMRVAFITNNAARPAGVVAAHLADLGVQAGPEDVVTSAQAAAGLVRERWGAGTRVVCLGGAGLRDALAERELVPVGPGEDAALVVTGYGPEERWADIMRVAVRVREGLPWVATNADGTIPTRFGVAPGHGVLVDMLRRFTGVTPQVAGKPERPLLDETVRRVGGRRPLMVGDRLDTDIEGGHNAGVATLLVLTGVTGLTELVAAPASQRPSYLATDLAGLATAHRAPERDNAGWRLGGWRARVVDGELSVVARGDTAGKVDDWWRVVAATAWEHHDTTGQVVDITATRVPANTTSAR